MLWVIFQACGLVAFSQAAEPPTAEKKSEVAQAQPLVVPQPPAIKPAETSKSLQIPPASAKGVVAKTVKAVPAPVKDDTPKGRYTAKVLEAVNEKWNAYRRMDPNGVTYASLEIVFYVNKQGKVEDPRVVDDKQSNQTLTILTLRAIKDAEIPPMPAEVFFSLPMNDPERLKIKYNALIY